MQSCGQTFMVTPITSHPSRCNNAAATLESTPPLIPSSTLLPLPFMGVSIWSAGGGVKSQASLGDTILAKVRFGH
jgi:hypothetical protein